MKKLLVGYRSSDLNSRLLEGDVVCHVLDVYVKHAIEKVFPSAKVVCSAHLPEEEFDVIEFKTGPKLMQGEVALSLLQEIALKKRGDLSAPGFILHFEGKERDRNDFLAKINGDPKRVRSFRAVWQASVPKGPRLDFVSYPGCFCHRRLDEGGLALAETVVRELSALPRNGDEPLRILDMGCGCGLVGLLIASVIPNIQLTFIDSHSRAIEAASENVRLHGIQNAEIVLADNGIDSLKGRKHYFDVFVGNPPYYSDYRIADVFLDTARKCLKWGGAAYSVCKNAAGLEPVQLKYFDAVETIKRRGYAVLKSLANK